MLEKRKLKLLIPNFFSVLTLDMFINIFWLVFMSPRIIIQPVKGLKIGENTTYRSEKRKLEKMREYNQK